MAGTWKDSEGEVGSFLLSHGSASPSKLAM